MLKLEQVKAGYGDKLVLNGVNLALYPGEICGLVGPNGSGKSTVLKSIFGMVRVISGNVIYMDQSIQNRNASINVRSGISYIPQGSKVFGRLTVQENLELGGSLIIDRKKLNERIESMYERFPRLKNYRSTAAENLSGGERQLVGFCIGLIMEPRCLLIDEPSIGLAPKLVAMTMDLVLEIRDKFNASVLMVEQNVRALLAIANRIYLLRNGEIAYQENNVNGETEKNLRERFLG